MRLTIDAYADQARVFVCQYFGEPNCLRDVQVRVDGDTNGFLAYFHPDQKKISLSTGLNPIETQLNLVHEYTHAYRDLFRHEEDTWLNEALAKFIESRYSTVWPVSYHDKLRKNPDLRLSNDENDFRAGGNGYASSFFFIIYLHNHFGGDALIRKLVRSSRTGWDSIELALKELKSEGRLTMNDSLLVRDSILRHFALSLWLNDPFAAKYALFQLDRRYEPLAMGSAGVAKIEVVPLVLESGESRIVFSRRYHSTAASEVYALKSRSPVSIERVTSPSESTEIYIYIFRE